MTERIYFGFSVGNDGCFGTHRTHHKRHHYNYEHHHRHGGHHGTIIDDIFRRPDFMGHKTYFGWNPPFRGHHQRFEYHHNFHNNHHNNNGWERYNWHSNNWNSRDGQIFQRDSYYDNWGAGHATELVERLAWSPYVYPPYTGW